MKLDWPRHDWMLSPAHRRARATTVEGDCHGMIGCCLAVTFGWRLPRLAWLMARNDGWQMRLMAEGAFGKDTGSGS